MRTFSSPFGIFLTLLVSIGVCSNHDDNHIDILLQRDAEAVSLLDIQQPQAVRKMSSDPGEKFWVHYWEFDGPSRITNMTDPGSPLALHERSGSLLGRALFQRDAACPTTPYNTSSCASIGYPDSCCPVTSYCYTVTDTGNGPVGCCPNGGNCGSTVGTCQSGYTSCPNSSNKGCCIPGYICAGSICVNAGTSTAVISPTTSTTTITTPTSAVVSVTTVTLVNVSPSAYTTTATVTVTQSASSTSDSAVAPVRPTTDSSSSTASIAPAAVSSTTTTVTTSTSTASATTAAGYCPTGYYMCSAVYLGGCCQVDRDCNTTTCPPTASTTVINGSPTIVAPAGASSNSQTCASGWFSCPASLGGNCCPTGYNCAQTNCPAVATAAASHDKEAPSSAVGLTVCWPLAMAALLTAMGAII